jgi:hypothetical protein
MFRLKGNNDRAGLFLQSICLQPIYGERAVDPFSDKKEVAQKEEEKGPPRIRRGR